jgi:uncharacterized membrane protein
MWQDILEYFLSPTKTGYDVPKTMVYSLALVLAVYIGFKIFERLKIKVNGRFALATAPYVIFGSALRVLQDTSVVNSILFVTPHIYTFVASIASLIFLLSIFLERKMGIPYFKIPFICGIVLLAVTVCYLTPVNFYGMFLVAIVFLPWILVFAAIKWSLSNKIVTLIHVFDATTTFAAVNFFGYGEQHVLPRFLIDVFGPLSFVLVKLATVVFILLVIDKFSKDKEFNNYLKFVIGILGGATSARDLIALLTLA